MIFQGSHNLLSPSYSRSDTPQLPFRACSNEEAVRLSD
jgi:hypothetical protein